MLMQMQMWLSHHRMTQDFVLVHCKSEASAALQALC